jgi:acyl-coenzyme A synthetase/AMP-(fatty) acid ligase
MVPLPDSHLLASLSFLCVAGAASPPSLIQWAIDLRVPYCDLIGATEVAGALCIRKIFNGKPEAGFTLCHDMMGILEKSRDSDEFGELIVKGKVVMTSSHSSEDCVS